MNVWTFFIYEGLLVYDDEYTGVCTPTASATRIEELRSALQPATCPTSKIAGIQHVHPYFDIARNSHDEVFGMEKSDQYSGWSILLTVAPIGYSQWP